MVFVEGPVFDVCALSLVVLAVPVETLASLSQHDSKIVFGSRHRRLQSLHSSLERGSVHLQKIHLLTKEGGALGQRGQSRHEERIWIVKGRCETPSGDSEEAIEPITQEIKAGKPHTDQRTQLREMISLSGVIFEI